MEKKGRKLYNLFVGTPDFAPAPHIMEAVQKSAANPEDYKYSLVDIPELLDAVVDYYQERFQVSITPDMITGVHGSQEYFYPWPPGTIRMFPCLFLLLFRLLPKFDHLGEALYLIVHGIGDFTVAPKQSEFNIVVADLALTLLGGRVFFFA